MSDLAAIIHLMLQVASNSLAGVLAQWVAGGDESAFTAALASHECLWRRSGYAGGVDESLAVFDDHESWIACCLARQGHNVIALPTRHLAGLRAPDASVSGLLTEFKCYTGVDPRQLLGRFGHARPQADRVVVLASAPWDSVMLRGVFRAAVKSARRRNMQAVMLLGDGFQFEWGDWNGCLAAAGEPSLAGSA